MDARRIGRWMALALTTAPTAVGAQGWIEPPVGVDRGFAVERVRGEVQVHLEGRVARFEVTEWFRNDGGRVAEGHYLYPLPGEAVFQGFSLFQGDAELRGEIMDADRARAIYEEIVRRRADPALIELAGQGLLRARVFPIEPGDERKVTLRYTQVLARSGDALQMEYAGAVRGSSTRQTAGGRTHFEVTVAEGGAFLEPFSPTHALEVRHEGGRTVVRLDDDLVGRLSLFFPLANEGVGLTVATHRPVGEDGYVMLTLSPGRADAPPEPRDVTVVLDVSGSMSGEKIEQARAALHGLLGTLDRGDRFRLIAFSNAVRRHSDGWAPATRPELESARTWIDALVADGGTNIGGALDEAFRLTTPDDRLPVVVFLTDGLPSVGEQAPERLADLAERRAGRARVFAFGVGHDVNTHLLDRLGEAGRGATQYVQPGENVERALGLLAAKVRHPVLTDLEVDGRPVRIREMYPVRLPDVFAGEELVLFGRYSGEGSGRVTVRGRRAGRDAAFGIDVDFPGRSEANAYLPRLWASRKLGHLTRQLWTEGETESLVAEIRELALRYGLPSPYTSYLVQERQAVADAAPPLGHPRGPGFGRAVRPAASASGEAAVRQAEEARAFRDVTSTAAVREAELRVAKAVTADDDAVRAISGRIFREKDGVWIDLALDPALEVIRVKAFSPAWFDISRSLDEIRPVLGELTWVTVAGARIAIRVAEDGVEALDAAALARISSRFRGGSAP